MANWLNRVVLAASTAAKAMFNLAVGVTPGTLVDGDQWCTTVGLMGHSNGVAHPLGPYLGTFPDTITATAGQTTTTLTHTPASQLDIQIFYNGFEQDPANITGLAGKTITFTAANVGDILLFRYTRLD